MTEKILIHLIDGAEAWVPIIAKQTGPYSFEILDDSEFIYDDPSVIFEFYPGDIVEVEDAFDEEHQYKAVKLIQLSRHPDRKYLLFKYKATRHLMPVDKQSAKDFHTEIERIRNEINEGQFVYRGIKETLKYIDKNA
ncbi:MAG: hypothetical protein ABIO44_01615 [Saprospiraceae bacterium]